MSCFSEDAPGSGCFFWVVLDKPGMIFMGCAALPCAPEGTGCLLSLGSSGVGRFIVHCHEEGFALPHSCSLLLCHKHGQYG